GNPHELLWRRVADGADAPTRRVSGQDDPDDPACLPSDTIADPACVGPFKNPANPDAGLGDRAFSVSGDGNRGAFITDSAPLSSPTDSAGATFTAFISDMGPGYTRKTGFRELTRESIAAPGAADVSGQIGLGDANENSIAISSDGRWLAFPTT